MQTAKHLNENRNYDIKENLSVDEIIKLKKLSRKNSFTCLFCDAYVDFYAGEANSPFFRHRANQSCFESKEYEKRLKTYQDYVKRESRRHPAVISFIKDELDSLRKRHPNLLAYEGCLYKGLKRHIPDLVVELNNKHYAINIVTNISNSSDENLSKTLKDKINYFDSIFYKSIWLVEKSHETKELSEKEIVLWNSEQILLNKSNQDKQWSEFLSSFTTPEEISKIYDLKTPISSLDVKSIIYLSSEDNAKFDIYRVIEEPDTKPFRAFILGQPYQITLHDMFEIQSGEFILENPSLDLSNQNYFKDNYQQKLQASNEKEKMLQEIENKRIEQLVADQLNLFESTEKSVNPTKFEPKLITYNIKEIEDYKKYLNEFTIEKVNSELDEKLKKIFNLYVNKFKLTNQNFPGLCKIIIEDCESLPYHHSIWQLWILDKITTIYQNDNLTIYALCNRFIEQFGLERDQLNLLREVFKKYILILNQVKILGEYDQESIVVPIPVKIHHLPLIHSFKENSYLAFFLSKYYNSEDSSALLAKNAYLKYKEIIENPLASV